MSTCVPFPPFSGIIFTVGTRWRLRFAATFLFWTYCISQGMVRVCPFADFLSVPGWNLIQVQSSNLRQMRIVLLMSGRWPIFARQLALYWSFIVYWRQIFSSISVGPQTSFFSWWLCKFVESFSVQVWFTSCIIGFPLMGIVIFSARCSRRVKSCSGDKQKRSLVSIASHVGQLTQGVSRLWVSTGLFASGEQLTASAFGGPGSIFAQHAGSSCVTTQRDFWPGYNSLYQCWDTSQVLFSLFRLLLTVLWTKLSTWTMFSVAVTLPYNNWSDSAPAYSPGCVYASWTSS